MWAKSTLDIEGSQVNHFCSSKNFVGMMKSTQPDFMVNGMMDKGTFTLATVRIFENVAGKFTSSSHRLLSQLSEVHCVIGIRVL